MLMFKIGLIARLPLKIKCYAILPNQLSVMEHVVGDIILVPINGLPIPKLVEYSKANCIEKDVRMFVNLTESHITRERQDTSWEMPWSLSKRSPYERA